MAGAIDFAWSRIWTDCEVKEREMQLTGAAMGFLIEADLIQSDFFKPTQSLNGGVREFLLINLSFPPLRVSFSTAQKGPGC